MEKKEDVESTKPSDIFTYTDQMQQENDKDEVLIEQQKALTEGEIVDSQKASEFYAFSDRRQQEFERQPFIKDSQLHKFKGADLAVTKVPFKQEINVKPKDPVLIDQIPSVIESEPKLPIPEALRVIPHYEIGDNVKFEYNDRINRFMIHINNEKVRRVLISDQLNYMLGFREELISQSTVAKYPPNLNGHISSIYVYMPKNVIHDSIHSNVMAPVLRVFAVGGKVGEMVENVFIDPEYHSLVQKEISQLSFEIKSSDNRLIPFSWGSVTLTLKFKKESLL